MIEALVLAAMAGLLLGAFFYGGLWWTVRKGVSSKQPALLFLCSLLLRTGGTVAVLYVVSGGHWQRLLACLLGFTVARLMVTRFAGPPVDPHTRPVKEVGHAP